jgi:hypothetical protein
MIGQALAILSGPNALRAEQIQLVFSRPYAANWQAAFKREKMKP